MVSPPLISSMAAGLDIEIAAAVASFGTTISAGSPLPTDTESSAVGTWFGDQFAALPQSAVAVAVQLIVVMRQTVPSGRRIAALKKGKVNIRLTRSAFYLTRYYMPLQGALAGLCKAGIAAKMVPTCHRLAIKCLLNTKNCPIKGNLKTQFISRLNAVNDYIAFGYDGMVADDVHHDDRYFDLCGPAE